MPPPEKPLPRPKPKPPKPKPKLKKGPADAKPMPVRPSPERDGTNAAAGVPILQQPFACETYRLCPPPPSPPATVHLRSGRLPTPLIAVSASLLALSAVLLLAVLVRYLLLRRRRHQQQHAQAQQEAPMEDDDDEESVLGMDTTAWGPEAGEGEEVDSGDVHHVWFIRTKGLDERAIAAIAAVVYDASKKKRAGGEGGADDGEGCAVCLAEFRDGETLRLLPRCGHAFHRGCIDTWLRAHVNCPLCRAPVQVHAAGAGDKASATSSWVRSQAEANHGGARAEEEEAGRGGGVVVPERAVRRAASMVTVPRRAWPDVAVQAAPASSSGREEDMTGLAKIMRLLKLSEAIGVGRSASFGAGSCQRLPTTTRSGPSAAAAGVVNGDGDIESSR